MAYPSSSLMSRTSSSDYSQAFSLSPSGNWDGNDGAWSTFIIRIGTPPQLFRVLPSTGGHQTWVPIPDRCEQGQSWCGNARGVEPFNGASSSPFSGSPNEQLTTSLDPGMTCTANRSPMCVNCVSIDGKCTNGPCTGRNCCGDPAGNCNGQGCNGLNGICTGPYIGCPCDGVDFNAPTNVQSNAGVYNVAAASGFQANLSSSWSALGKHEILTDGHLSGSSSAPFGTDVVGLGVDATIGLTLNQSLVAGISTEPFYNGLLGLKPTNSSSVNNGTGSFMMQLKQQNLIPSLSYGYTAGAIYRQPPVLGSLTFGGFDSSRSLSSNTSFPLAGNDSSSLVIGIISITSTNYFANNANILSKGITASIDSTLPFIWLPISACQVFEDAFGLTWDDSKDLYLLNDTAHQRLSNTNSSITFTLGNLAQTASTNITLPYDAFDLQASNPTYPNGTNYFPLKRASSASQYTLGRVFLQEAFLFVDFEESRFQISQAQYPTSSSPQITTVDHSVQPPTISPNIPTSDSATHHISHGAIAGIIIGSLAGIALILVLAFYLLRRHCRSPTRHQPSDIRSSSVQGKESWLDSPSNSRPSGHFNNKGEYFSGGELGTNSRARTPTKTIGELEDRTTGITGPSMSEISWPVSRPRHELSAGEIAKELPPIPDEESGSVIELPNDNSRFGQRKT